MCIMFEKKIRNFAAILLNLFFACMLSSCSNSDEAVVNNNDVLITCNKIFTNKHCSIYMDTKTRAVGGSISYATLTDYPNVVISSSNNDDIEYKKYDQKSIFYDNGVQVCVFYSKLVEKENGYLLYYNVVGGDMGCSFLPKLSTRRAASIDDCVTDAFNNHGWISDFAYYANIITVGAVHAAISADCVLHSLFC